MLGELIGISGVCVGHVCTQLVGDIQYVATDLSPSILGSAIEFLEEKLHPATVTISAS